MTTHTDAGTAPPGATKALRIGVYGTVQGVGFRPFVYRLAAGLGLYGDVRNAGGHVVVRVADEHVDVDAFVSRLAAEAPRRSVVDRVTLTELTGDRPASRANSRLATR